MRCRWDDKEQTEGARWASRLASLTPTRMQALLPTTSHTLALGDAHNLVAGPTFLGAQGFQSAFVKLAALAGT